ENSAVAFSEMETLHGAEDFADVFIINSMESQPIIVAGDGDAIDAINYSGITDRSITVTLGDAGLTGFESVIGNGIVNEIASTLIGANYTNVWTLDETGQGQVLWNGQTTSFSNFGRWVGGSGNDDFNLHALIGAPAFI